MFRICLIGIRWLGLSCPILSCPMIFFVFCWPLALALFALPARGNCFTSTWIHICAHLDQMCFYKSKGYHERSYLVMNIPFSATVHTWSMKVETVLQFVKENSIEYNYSICRFPWACLGCGSWNQDSVRIHHFDRGAFGFRKVHCASIFHCLFLWDCFGIRL